MPAPSSRRLRRRLLLPLAVCALAPPAARAQGLSLEEAIRAAWGTNPGLAAGAAQVEAAQAEAAVARDGHWPTVSLQARGVRTDEPAGAFGLRLDQQRISAADFAPDRLNHPAAVGGLGLSATLGLPIYLGGRISAGGRAAEAQAQAEAHVQERRRQETALAVVEAYFGSGVADQGLRFATDVVEQARETERFVKERAAQGLALDADVARATAFRAQAEAEEAGARQRQASARSALALLAGDGAGTAGLTTALPGTAEAAPLADAGRRSDLRAAWLRADAAAQGAVAARGSLLPEIVGQASVETMRSAPDQGARWTTLALVARWQLSLGEVDGLRAARARARAAEEAARWQERQAAREVDEARRALEAAQARIASAEEAVAASESARALRRARHRQGLLPLADLLDAEAGLAGARALLLQSRLQARVARAQSQLALGLPVEGVTP